MTDRRPDAPKLYILEGHDPVATDDAKEWATRYDISNRQVAEDTIGIVRISTVFLGLDVNHGLGGPPQLFETMIFGGAQDRYQQRCSTWEEAEAMHARLIALVASGLH